MYAFLFPRGANETFLAAAGIAAACSLRPHARVGRLGARTPRGDNDEGSVYFSFNPKKEPRRERDATLRGYPRRDYNIYFGTDSELCEGGLRGRPPPLTTIGSLLSFGYKLNLPLGETFPGHIEIFF